MAEKGKIFLYMDHSDAYEPVHSIAQGHQSLHLSAQDAIDQRKKNVCDFAQVFELDLDAMTVKAVAKL